jgi:uncharacterized Zn-binding protein involved in type VI secretion
VKSLRTLLGTISLGLLAASAGADEHSISAWSGKWAADISRLPIPAETRPKSVTITFGAATDGRLATRVEVTTQDDTIIYAESVAELNGTPVATKGELEADTVAAAMPASNVLIMQLSRAGVPGSTRIYTLSADRKSMIETAANFGADGRPYMRTNYFTRVE